MSSAQFSFLDCRMAKSSKAKIDILNIKIVYHCILQVHYIFNVISSCMVTTPTSFI